MINRGIDWTSVGNAIATSALGLIAFIAILGTVGNLLNMTLDLKTIWQGFAVLLAVASVGFHLKNARVGAVISLIAFLGVLFHLAVT